MNQRNRAVAWRTAWDTSLEARIGSKVTPLRSGCWQYGDGSVASPRVLVGNRQERVFNFLYEAVVEPIPEGHHLHHKCENGWCVNPWHGDPLTPSEHSGIHAALRTLAGIGGDPAEDAR